MTEEQQKFYDIKNYKKYMVCGDDVDYAIIIDKENKCVILQFRESNSKRDWANNLNFIPSLLKLENKKIITTRGYKKAYSSALNLPVREKSWHDLRKDPDDLPKECTTVLAIDNLKDKEIGIYRFVCSNQWEWLPRRISVLSNKQIIAWCEIPAFNEE